MQLVGGPLDLMCVYTRLIKQEGQLTVSSCIYKIYQKKLTFIGKTEKLKIAGLAFFKQESLK